MTDSAQPGKKLSASEKKKARKQKAKQDKKALKLETQKVHEELHKAQELESESSGKGKGGKNERTVTLAGSNTQVVVEYVPSPLSAVEELKQEADDAAVAVNPFSGLGTGQTDTASAVAELDRIAKHFLPEDDVKEDEGEDKVAEEAAAGTDAVVRKGKDDAKEVARKEAEAAAGAPAFPLPTCTCTISCWCLHAGIADPHHAARLDDSGVRLAS